ncbi:MAG TPA: hypothetical protein VI386_10105 [Candidatus Sulfotelmatobacter sp.]
MFAPIAPMIGAFQNIPLPMLDQIGNLLQQAAHLDWMEIFEALKEQDAGTFSVSKLYDFDSQAIDREYGVCPLPLYEFETTDWSLFEAGKDIDEIQARLKALDIFQYFFPPPDQLALALAERGVTHKPEIMEILNGSSEVGHPLGASELVSSTIDIPNLIDALAERKYVAEIQQDISVTKAGRRERTKIRTKPRESVVSKLLNRFKITLKVNISTKDIWPR